MKYLKVKKHKVGILLALLTASVGHVSAGALDPDCTAKKAAKTSATKAVIGVGGRCKPKDAASDTAKKAAGIDDDKGLKKKNKNKGGKDKVKLDKD